ncbi:MAG: helix-turn-helix transcriptional regulator [Paludibacter sp.]
MRIKELIKEKGLTVADVAAKMGVKSPSLSRAINGNTTVEMLNRIATVLDVPVSSLFESETNLYGVVVFKGKTYKVDSDQALQSFLKEYSSGTSTKSI